MNIPRTLLIGSLTLLPVLSLHAGLVGVTGVTGTEFVSPDYGPYNITAGWEFSPNQNLEVSALGFYAAGLNSDLPVGLWSGDGSTLLAQVSVTTTSDPHDGFRWAGLTSPVSLSQGQTYLLGAWLVVGSDNSALWNAASASFHSALTYKGGRFFADPDVPGSPLTAPTFPAPDDQALGYFGPNLEFETECQPVPEPSTVFAGCVLVIPLLWQGFRSRLQGATTT